MRGDQPVPVDPVEKAKAGGAAQRIAGVGGERVERVEPCGFDRHPLFPSTSACGTSCAVQGAQVQAPDPTPRPLDHLTLMGDAAAPALATGESGLDFAGLGQAAGALAAGLAARGLEPGGRVASWLPKGRLTSLLPLAAARAGLVHVPINPLLKRLQVGHILADS